MVYITLKEPTSLILTSSVFWIYISDDLKILMPIWCYDLLHSCYKKIHVTATAINLAGSRFCKVRKSSQTTNKNMSEKYD